MRELWTCPRCGRKFRQINQRHSCGTGDPAALLRGRSQELAQLYHKLETAVTELAGVEIVYRRNYALFRTSRIFADLVLMRDALRLVVHLKREVDEPIFCKVVRGRKDQISHVAKLRTEAELALVLPYVREAYRESLRE